MPHYVQAKRDVGGHVVDRDEDVPQGHVIEADGEDHAMDLVATNHFLYRGEHDSTPPSLPNPLELDDPTVYSLAEVLEDEEDEEEEERPEEETLDVDEGEEGQTTPGQPEHPMGDEVDSQQFGDEGPKSGDPLTEVHGIGDARSQELTDEFGIETAGQLAESDQAPEHLVEKAQEHVQA